MSTLSETWGGYIGGTLATTELWASFAVADECPVWEAQYEWVLNNTTCLPWGVCERRYTAGAMAAHDVWYDAIPDETERRRRILTEMLQDNDRNGVWSDAACEAEGYRRTTMQEAIEAWSRVETEASYS